VKTFSCYAKAAEWGFVGLAWTNGSGLWAVANFNLSTGAYVTTTSYGGTSLVDYSIATAGNGWYRVSITTLDNSVVTYAIIPAFNGADPVNPSYTGNGVDGIYVWGAQLEAGEFATSYIPTVASQATRNADVASMTGTNFSSWYRQDEGTLFAQTQRNGASSTVYEGAGIEVTDGSIQSNMMQLMYDNGSFNSAALRVFPGVGSFTIRSNGGSPNYTPGEPARKFAAAYKSADSGISAAGTAVTTNTTVYTPPPVTLLSIRTASNGLQGSDFNGTIRRIAYYPARLSNAQLQALTS
jgi:hypothetical protein